jgi:hypothetical protein
MKLYLIGSLQNLVDPDVSEELLNGVILQVSVSPVHLNQGKYAL